MLAGALVAPGFVAVEALVGAGEGIGDVERLLDRVGDPLRGRGVLEVAGVADQRPAGAGWRRGRSRAASSPGATRIGEICSAPSSQARVEPLELLQALDEEALALLGVAAGQLRRHAQHQDRDVVLALAPAQRAPPRSPRP